MVAANDHLLRPLHRPLAQLFLRLLQAGPIKCAAAEIATLMPVVSPSRGIEAGFVEGHRVRDALQRSPSRSEDLYSLRGVSSTLLYERNRKFGEVNNLRCNRPRDQIENRTHATRSHHNPIAAQGLGARDN